MPARILQLLTVALLALAACSQGEGESCQVDRDCDDGLMCFNNGGERARCKPDDDAGAGRSPVPPDSGLRPDEPEPVIDAGSDAGMTDGSAEEDGG